MHGPVIWNPFSATEHVNGKPRGDNGRPASEHDPRRRPERRGLRGLPENWVLVGAFALVPDLRSRRLLRLLSASACKPAFPQQRAPDYPTLRTGRGLALVLCRPS